jgi:hypothetical protein
MFNLRPKLIKSIAASLPMPMAHPAIARAGSWQPISVHVSGIEADRGGQLKYFVFLKDGFPIKHEKALKIHHDKDSNGKVSKNWTGISPVKGFGFSAGARMKVLPPRFSDAQIVMPEDKTVSISILYP